MEPEVVWLPRTIGHVGQASVEAWNKFWDSTPRLPPGARKKSDEESGGAQKTPEERR